MPRWGTGALAALVLSLAATGASAEESTAGAREKALQLFRQSEEKYRTGNFDEAARLLEEAHRLHDEPVLLYNLARAYEGMGERQKAVDAYQGFLERSPDTKDRGAIERRVETLKSQIAEQARLESDKRRLERERRSKPQRSEQPRAEPERDSGSIWPWVTAGSGVALIGAGAVFGVLAQSKRDDADEDPVHRSSRETFRDAEDLATTANVLFIVGGVVAAGGVTWIVLSSSTEPSRAELRIGPGNVAVGGRF